MICLSVFVILVSISTSCLDQNEKDAFILTSEKATAQLIIDTNENQLVFTAARLFSDDINKIRGKQFELNATGDSVYQIKVGTLGLNPDFDQECEATGIAIDSLKGKREAYILKVTQNKGKHILYLVGSDPRGTAYGLMELSRTIGVSPWVWWADVKPQHKEEITLPANFYVEDSPKVKFRGIFLNDEDWGLQPWAAKTFEPETGDIGPKTYEKIFELLLRLKANAIWPAMHDCTRAFFTYPNNIKMADKYGIWVGSSHCEPMLRNNVDEWHRWNPTSGKRGNWNFDENPEQIAEYWKQRVDTAANYDGIYTVGMRGIHDGGMPGGKNLNDKVDILGNVLNKQRNLLSEIKEEEITNIPQIFCPYKEMLQLYKAGAKIPEDVTIMWADDNNGYIRQLSNLEERKRSGGAGVYYHISYWGRPHDYLWLESTPVSLIWEEMNKAYQTNAKNVWIVNVGDIKSNEIGTNFFLDMAWDPEQFIPESLDSYYSRFAETHFGKQYSNEIGEILREYFQLGFSRKPEHMGYNGVYPNTPIYDPEFFLFHNGDEVHQRIDAYDKLEKQVEKLYEKMPDNLKDAFYQLVAYKVIGVSNMNKKILYAYKSRTYTKQGRTSAGLYADKAKEAFERIKDATSFYNDTIAHGKWKHMMSYNPRELPVFDMPPTNTYHPIYENAGGIMPEGYLNPIAPNANSVSLPVFNSLTDRRYFIDVYNSGSKALKWGAKAEDSWVKISKTSGETKFDERIWVSINWNAIATNDTKQSKVLFKLNGQNYPVNIKALKSDWSVDNENFFVEDIGIVCIEAEGFVSVQNKTDGYWKRIQGLGRYSDAMGTFPVTAEPFDINDLSTAPELRYDFHTTSSGEVKLKFHCLPNQPINDCYKLRFAYSIDNAEPIIINAALNDEMNENNQEWKEDVLNAVRMRQNMDTLKEKGKHQLKITMIDPGVVLDKIEILMLGKPESEI